MRTVSILIAVLMAFTAIWAIPVTAKPIQTKAYHLHTEWHGPCRRRDTIDVDLGNTPEVFVRAAACQVTGRMPASQTAHAWVERLRNDAVADRTDIVKMMCKQAYRTCSLSYSTPWEAPEASSLIDCAKKHRRDIGAVVMFFFHCPGGDNCRMDWAGSHAPGMDRPDRRLGFAMRPSGYYNADNPGFWAFELSQARAAGLQFILPNVYGPDMAAGQVDTLAKALKAGAAGPVRIGLFDDTWAWGETKFGADWTPAPDLSETEAAAQRIYRLKWQPFFRKIPAEDWYRINGKPLIYLYNAGTLKPANRAAAVVARLKTLFAAEFGVEPYVAVDDAFFADPDMPTVADTRFRWDTFSAPFAAADGTVALHDGISQSDMGGRRMTSAMVRWDSHARDALEGHPDVFAGRTIKGPERLRAVLDATRDADSLVLETWNDLGEGTGVDWNYDYSDKGRWLAPDTFIRQIRASQCRN